MTVPAAPETANGVTAESSSATEEQKTGATAGSSTAEANSNVEPANTGDQGAEPAGKQTSEEPKVKLSELTAQRKKRQDAERLANEKAAEAAYWRGRAEGSVPVTKPDAQSVEKEPSIDDFEGPTAYEDYITARTEYRITQKQQAANVRQSKQNAESAIEKTFAERVQAASIEIPDLQDAFSPGALPIFQNEVVLAVKESELGPKLLYHLAKNPSEANRIAGLSPLSAVRELGKLEIKLSNSETKPKIKTSQAAEPITRTLAGNAQVDDDISTLPTADYIARRNKEAYGR